MELEDLWAYRVLLPEAGRLPAHRTEAHDTAAYMLVINAKVELVHRAMQLLPTRTHFAWVDFGLFKVFRDKARCAQQLACLTQSALRTPLLLIPGCWPAGTGSLWDAVNWRFCGGFFLGDRVSLGALHTLYQAHFEPAVRAHTLVWEVNFWAYLEREHGWCPEWYASDHDDGMLLHAPRDVFDVVAVAVVASIPSV